MEVILSILVALQVIVAGIWYPKSHIDHQIEAHRAEIEAYKADEVKMQQLRMYHFKETDDRIIVIDPDEEG